MGKHIAVIPRTAIARATLVGVVGRSMKQVKAACGRQYILSSRFYDITTGRPAGNPKIGGAVRAAAGWSAWGPIWDKGADIHLDIVLDGDRASYLSGVELLILTRGPGKALNYPLEYEGIQGRSAVLLTGARVILCCSGDGTVDDKTPGGLRDELVSTGCRYGQAVNLRVLDLNSGGSSQYDFGDGKCIYSTRRMAGYLCVWTKRDGQKPPEQEDRPTSKYTVTSSVGVNTRNGPGTSYGKVGAYPMGVVVDVLEVRDDWGRMTKGQVSLAHLKVVEGLRRVIGSGIAVQEHITSDGRKNRPGRDTNPGTYTAIYGTGNATKGTDAMAHGVYLGNATGEGDLASWHYTVDGHAIAQYLPDYETVYHTGDGKSRQSNTTSIAVETCANAGGDLETIKANVAALVCLLTEEHDIPPDSAVQHNRWNDKDCPEAIRATAGTWEALLAFCHGKAADVSDLDVGVDTLVETGIISSPNYWRAGDYFATNIQALIGEVVDYVQEDE